MSTPNRIRSAWRRKKARAEYGWRPRSPRRAAVAAVGVGRPQLGGGGPECAERRVVDRHEPAVEIAGPQSQQLPDLQPAGSARHRLAESLRLDLAEAPVARPRLVVEAGEDGDTARIRRLPSLDLRREGVALAAVEIDDGLDPGLIERCDQLSGRPGCPLPAERRPQVVVCVDHGELRPEDIVDRNAE